MKTKRMALEALKFAYNESDSDFIRDLQISPAIAALEAEIAQEVEPAAYLHLPGVDGEEYSDCFEVNIVAKEAEKLQTALVKYSDIDGLTIPLFYIAAPQAVNAQDQQDAQRYRYLRDTKMLDQWIWDALEHTEGDEYCRGLDAAIDAAIAKAEAA